MKPWRTVKKEILLNHSKYLKVEKHTIELPDGRLIESWPWVISPDFINLAAVTSDGKFICFRQTKYAVDGISLAPVGGYIEQGEIPVDAAKRELLEETGFTSDEWITLGEFPVDGNHGCGTAYLFLALNAQYAAEPVNDDLEEQEMVFLSLDEIDTALSKGEFKILSWTALISLSLRYLKKENLLSFL